MHYKVCDVTNPHQHRPFGIALLLLLFLVGCGQPSEKDLLQSAQQFIDKQDYRAAEIELKTLLSKTPASGQARYLYGFALMRQGQFVQALTEYDKAVDLGYDQDQLLARRATALLANARFKDLLKDYGDVTLADKPSQAELRTAVAGAYLRERKIPEAEAALADALSAVPDYGWALLNKARIAVYRGNANEGFKLIDDAIKSGTNNGEAWHMKAALLQVARGDFAGAEQAYLESIKDPRFAVLARADLVTLYLRLKRVDDAKQQLLALKKSSPAHPTTLFVEAQIAFLGGDMVKAAENLDKLLRASPKDDRLLVFAGAVDLTRGALLAAETKLGKALLFTNRQPVARRLLAATYLRMGQPEKALGALQSLLEGAPPDGNAQALAGEAMLQLGDAQRAEDYFSGALKQMAGDVRLRTAVALADLAQGDVKGGFAALEKIASADEGDIADKALISSYMKRREHDAALAAIDRLARKKPGDATVGIYRALALRAKGDLGGARSAFDAVLKTDPANVVAAANLASIELQERKPDEARLRLESAIKASPRSLGLRIALFNVLKASGAPADAVKATLAESISALPREPALRVALVDFLLGQKDARSALTAAQQALSSSPDNVSILDAVGRALVESGDDEQAISVFGKAATLSPRNAQPHVRLADVYGKRKNMKAAAASLRRAFELEPDNDGVHRRMLSLANLTKDPSLALWAAKTLQRDRPDRVIGYYIEGDVHASRGNWPAAIAAFKGAIGKADGGSFPQIRVHDAILASGQNTAAERYAQDWIKANPKDARFIEHIADITLRRKSYAAAEALLKQALEADPKSAVALNNLAWSLAERGAPGAVELAERALKLAPDSPPILDTLAKALARQKEYTRAIATQRRAITGGKDDGLYRLHLAGILAASGDKAGALSELDAVAALGDTFPGQAAVAALRKSLQSK